WQVAYGDFDSEQQTLLDPTSHYQDLTWRTFYDAGSSDSTYRHLCVDVEPYLQGTYKKWIITPQIDLASHSGQDGVCLTFDLWLTDTDGKSQPAPDYGASFIVAVSTDDGLTWESTSDFQWSSLGRNDYATLRQLRQHPVLDLSAYAGKTIRIAFYSSPGGSAHNMLHIDNIHVNSYLRTTYEDRICSYDDYADNGFAISQNDLQPGMNLFRSNDAVSGNGANAHDYMRELSLYVIPSAETTINDRSCIGHSYQRYGFDIGQVTVSTYKRKLKTADGCDSIVNLVLNTTPQIYTTVFDSICYGKPYRWNSHALYTAGTYVDTLTSSAGCDSIVTLHLSLTSGYVVERHVDLCHGKILRYDDQVISSDGTYHVHSMSDDGCDTLLTLHVTTLPDMRTTHRAAICQGQTYSWDNDRFHALSRAGTYAVNLQSTQGCDSTITLRLLVVTPSGDLKDTITTADLPYTINDYTLLNAQADAGDYTLHVYTDCGRQTLLLHVDQKTSVSGPTASQRISISPNPVHAGQNVQITTDNIIAPHPVIYIYTSDGRLTEQHAMSTSDGQTTFTAPQASGLYLIRIGQTYSRLIVR
ncbi:MAG: choice-of-anchor J domain-containing protein, partial [Paludibacteraceae bacterium]|nr:choice-of-anchor J domain-containing protein [Paludibacteraceae bacterium]